MTAAWHAAETDGNAPDLARSRGAERPGGDGADMLARPSPRVEALRDILTRRTLERVQTWNQDEISWEVDELLHELAEVLGADLAFVVELSQDGTTWAVTHEWGHGTVSSVADLIKEMSADRFPWTSRQLAAGRVVDVPTIDDLPPEASPERDELAERDAKSSLTAPLMLGETRIGLLSFNWASPRENEVSPEEVELVRAMVSTALHEHRSMAALAGTSRMLDALIECSDALLHAEDETVLLEDVCRIIVELGGYRFAWIGLGDTDKDKTVRPLAKWGHDDNYFDNIHATWGDLEHGNGPMSRAVRTRQPAAVQSVATDPDFAPWREEALKRNYKSILAVSLDFQDGLPGAMGVYSDRAWAFDDHEIELMQRFADYLAYGIVALRNRAGREMIEEQLRATMRSKDELVASISHELRTPLTAVVGFAQLLQDSADIAPEDREAMIRSIVEEGADLANIVEDLLTVAKAESGTLTVVRVPVDLRAQANQVVESLRDEDAAHVTVTGEARRAVGDPGRARQILRNLVSNALRYGGEEVTVEVVDAHQPRVRVLDNGEGIPESERERIFESYQKAHNAPGLAGSIGLGLAISRSLARLMDGDLTYSYEGGRSIFEFTLPS
jgi:signal transduction histidine kinase